MPVSPPPSGAAVVAFQQDVLYDRRGGKFNDILYYRALVLINGTEEPATVAISRQLLSEETRRLDMETFFAIMIDMLPPGVVFPAAERIRELPPPAQEQGAGGSAILQWEQTTVNPGEAVIAYYSGYFQDPAELVQGDAIVLPLASVRAAGSLAENALRLKYTVSNTGKVSLEDVRLSVFLPNKVEAKPGGRLVPLYGVVEQKCVPTESDFIKKVGAVDGRLTMAEGNMFQYSMPRLKPGEEQELTYEATVQPTGNHGEVVPYIDFVCHAITEPVEDFTVQVVSPASATVSFTPRVDICNMGWPDVVHISF